jgi:hypothetical protein
MAVRLVVVGKSSSYRLGRRARRRAENFVIGLLAASSLLALAGLAAGPAVLGIAALTPAALALALRGSA